MHAVARSRKFARIRNDGFREAWKLALLCNGRVNFGGGDGAGGGFDEVGGAA